MVRKFLLGGSFYGNTGKNVCRLSCYEAKAGSYPEKVIQFGEGNFLRAFIDWIIWNTNQKTDFNAGIVVVQPIDRGMVDMLSSQDGLYHVNLQGIDKGEAVEILQEMLFDLGYLGKDDDEIDGNAGKRNGSEGKGLIARIKFIWNKINDDTDDIIKELQKVYHNLYITNIPQETRIISHKKLAITVGVKAAKNEILLFTDADCRPLTSNWIKTMVRNFDNQTEFVLGHGNYYREKGFISSLISYDTLTIAMQYMGFALLGHAGRAVQQQRAVHKENICIFKIHKLSEYIAADITYIYQCYL